MKFLAATLILFIGVAGDLALASATSSASAARPAHSLSVVHLHREGTVTNLVHTDPFVWGH